jgi:hypothetical protein
MCQLTKEISASHSCSWLTMNNQSQLLCCLILSMRESTVVSVSFLM